MSLCGCTNKKKTKMTLYEHTKIVDKHYYSSNKDDIYGMYIWKTLEEFIIPIVG